MIETINIEFSKDQAIVLLEYISNAGVVKDPAEQEILWLIECALEKQLTEPFDADYEAIVVQAKKSVLNRKQNE